MSLPVESGLSHQRKAQWVQVPLRQSSASQPKPMLYDGSLSSQLGTDSFRLQNLCCLSFEGLTCPGGRLGTLGASFGRALPGDKPVSSSAWGAPQAPPAKTHPV